MSEAKKRVFDRFILMLLLIIFGAGIILVIYAYEKWSKLPNAENAGKPISSAQDANESQSFFSDETEQASLLTGEAPAEFEQHPASPPHTHSES
ncbi:MAG: hypothetical protein ACTTJZ_00075 [Sphaerochaetaceae bacterium]